MEVIQNKKSLFMAYVMLMITSIGWAFSTILIKLYIGDIPAYHMMLGRFFIGFLVLWVLNPKIFKKISLQEIKIGCMLGACIFASYAFAIVSLQHTSASKAGFLVALSVLFVPLAQMVVHKSLPNKWTLLSVALSLIGLWMISGMNGTGFNYGDGLAIVSGLAYTAYILLIDKYAGDIKETILVILQLLIVSIISLVFTVLYDGLNINIFVDNIIPITLIALFGTVITTFFQAKAQKTASPESVGIILLGEPLFTLLMAIVILGENIETIGLVGAAVLLSSMGIAVIKKV